MSRKFRKVVLQTQIESTYGLDPGSWVGDDAILMSKPKFRIERTMVPRDLVRGYYGNSEELVASHHAVVEFDVELAGSGTPGTPPAWGLLMRQCGMAETITAGTSVQYTPISDNQESGYLRYFLDGVGYYARGVRGTCKIDLPAYGIPIASFTFTGFDARAFATAYDRATFADWVRPVPVTDANSSSIKIGGTLSGSTWTGGAQLASRGMQFDVGNKVEHMLLVGDERIAITDRQSTGKITVALAAADEVQWYDDITNNVTSPFSFTHGTEDGNIIALWARTAQRVNPNPVEYNGQLLYETDLRLLPAPATTGDNEFSITVK